MKLELKENMYVRIKDGIINKIISIKKLDEKAYLLNGFYINKDAIKKTSYDIIDILEYGDIISFYEDIDNYKKQYVIGILDLITLDEIKDKITNDNIRLVSILTKEQMEQMAYKVGEQR